MNKCKQLFHRKKITEKYFVHIYPIYIYQVIFLGFFFSKHNSKEFIFFFRTKILKVKYFLLKNCHDESCSHLFHLFFLNMSGQDDIKNLSCVEH